MPREPNPDLVATLRPLARRIWQRQGSRAGVEAIVQSAIDDGAAWVRHGRLIQQVAPGMSRRANVVVRGELVLAVQNLQSTLVDHHGALGDLTEFAERVVVMDPEELLLNVGRELDGHAEPDDVSLVAGLNALRQRLRFLPGADELTAMEEPLTHVEQNAVDQALIFTAVAGIGLNIARRARAGIQQDENRITLDMLGERTLEALENVPYIYIGLDGAEFREDDQDMEGLTIAVSCDVASQTALLRRCLGYCAINRDEICSAIEKDQTAWVELHSNVRASSELSRAFRAAPELRELSTELGLTSSRGLS